MNLNNTNLEEESGKLLKEALRYNSTLILLDIEGNKKMKRDDVIEIQKILRSNKLAYDLERKREFHERNRMFREKEISEILLSQVGMIKVKKDAIDERISNRKKQMEEEWNKKVFL